jgi:hypothetical protein
MVFQKEEIKGWPCESELCVRRVQSGVRGNSF